jgi:ATP-dependent 26S proteasome regulatory subunit
MQHEAIYNLYPNVTAILDAEDGLQILEGSEEITDSIDFEAVQELSDELQAEADLNALKAERNKRIAETDWWALTDKVMTVEQQDYRQALRDITENYNSINNVVWPEKP